MKILITGAAGQLGSDLKDVLGGSHDLALFDLDLDVSDFAAVSKASANFKPEVIINSAAFTDVDGCETQSDLAYSVNAIGAQNLALAARAAGAVYMTVSTDFVFDGLKTTPYDEFDAPNPLSVYGRSKLAGETMVREVCPEHFIVRTAWLYGRNGNNFVKTMLRLADERDEITVVDDQLGSPTFSLDLARRMAELMDSGWYGTYHVTNSGQTTWNGFAKSILSLGGQNPDKIKPMKSADLNRPAPRPAYSVLRNYVSELRGLAPMRPYEDALREYFDK